MEPTISRFLLFLGSEFLFFVAAFAAAFVIGLLVLKNQALKGSYLVFAGLLMSFLTMLFLFLFIWILTGKSYLPLFTVLTSVSIVLILMVEFTWLIVGARNVPWVGQVIWTQYEFQQLVPTVNKVVQIAGGLAFIVYPMYIGYGYFGEAFQSEDWPRYVIQATLIVLVGFCWVLQIPQSLYIMTSRNLMEDTRSRIFITQLGSSVFMLLIISLFLWTIKGGGSTIGLLSEYFIFSPMVAYVAIGYLVILLIVPYLIGHYRSKEWIERLIGERRELIEKLSKGLAHPNLAKANNTLEDAEREIQAAIERVGEDRFLELARQLQNTRDQEHFVQRLALQELGKRDPRFIHAGRLGDLTGLIADCKMQLAQKSDEKEKREVLDSYVKALDKEKESQKEESAGSKPLVLVGLAALASAILNPILSLAAKFAASQLGLGR